MRKTVYGAPPHAPVDVQPEAVYAIQALAAGRATEHQQIMALGFIINEICLYYDLSYREDNQGGERATAFAEGKRYVGAQIVKFTKIIPKENR